MEHHKLCEVVESADKMFSPLLLGIVSLYIPLLCFSFYNVVNLPEKGKLVRVLCQQFRISSGGSGQLSSYHVVWIQSQRKGMTWKGIFFIMIVIITVVGFACHKPSFYV